MYDCKDYTILKHSDEAMTKLRTNDETGWGYNGCEYLAFTPSPLQTFDEKPSLLGWWKN
jgi:hypothetical protein